MSSLEKCLFSGSGLFVGGGVACFFVVILNYLYILSVALFANIFSHSESCLFVLFMVSFDVCGI